MRTILESFFSDAAGICGHENTFHAIFCHQLFLSGYPANGYAREYRLNPGSLARTDVVIFESQPIRGTHQTHPISPRYAIEFKGGAHSASNALKNAIDADGHCTDLDKLLSHRNLGFECWFVCVDVAELGIALSTAARHRVANRCSCFGINFAYYAQGERTFLLCQDGKKEECGISIESSPRVCQLTPHWSDCLPMLPGLVLDQSASEDTYATLLYSTLRQAGYGPHQLSLETYFNCARGTSRMKERPDMCIFSDEVNGRFNLYRRGDRNRKNDGLKIGNLHALIEIKGSSATEKLSDAGFYRLIFNDIEKLTLWRDCFRQTGYLSSSGTKPPPEYVMLAIDNRTLPLREDRMTALRDFAISKEIQFHYFHL